MKTFHLIKLSSILLASAAFGDQLLNVSYDPTREFYQEFNASFAKKWKQETGRTKSEQRNEFNKESLRRMIN